MGANNPRLTGYNLVPQYPWSINYFPYNFTSTGNGGQAGAIFGKLYFRQAFQSLVNQPLYIKQIDKGYGVPTYGPVPVCPTNSFATSTELSNPYAYSLHKAIALLTANGWSVKSGGTTTCSDAAKCGVPAGTPLSFNLQYASGTTAIDQLMHGGEVVVGPGRDPGEADHGDVRHGDRSRGAMFRVVVHLAARELGRRLDLRARLLPVR